MDTKSSKDPEVEKLQETEQKIDPEPVKPEKSQEEKANASRVSARDMIIKALKKTKSFLSDTLINICEESHQRFVDEYLSQFQDSFLSDRPLEENSVSEILITVLESLPRWNSDFEVTELVKKNCDRCKTDTEYPPQRSYGIIISANSLRETKYAFKDLSFQNLLKIIKINLKVPCKNEECGEQSYVQPMIKKLPSVFTIVLEWENNETEEEILDTVSILTYAMDISEIYDCEDDCKDTGYYLVSMVCSQGDGYNCLVNERNSWTCHFGTGQQEEIGYWRSFITSFKRLNMRPQILFFENVVKRDQILGTQRTTKSVVRRMKLAQIQHPDS